MYSGNNGNQLDMSRSGGMLMVSRGQLYLLTTFFITYPAYLLHLALQIYFLIIISITFLLQTQIRSRNT
jgi:hypothetical protein